MKTQAIGTWLVLAAAIGGCGGGGSGGGGSPAATNAWVAGSFQPASTFAAQCASPRSGTDVITGDPFPDMQGSTLTENNWLRSWSNDLYLWYNEITDRDPSLSTSPLAYFDLLKTTAT